MKLLTRAVFPALLALALIAVATSGRGQNISSIPDLYQHSYILETKGHYQRALSQVKKILREQPQTYVAQLRAGWLAYLAELHDDSLDAYRKAVQLKPKAIEPKLGLMLPLMARQSYSNALEVANSILQIDSKNYLARSRKAFVLYLMGRYAQAESQYRQVLALYPSDVEMMAGLGWSQLKQGKTQKAKATFSTLLEIAPKHVTGRDGLEECK